MKQTRSLVCEDPTNSVVIDNIGAFPFLLTATWNKGVLSIKVDQPAFGHPWPQHTIDFHLEECHKDANDG
jgi:hypothetical protein